MAKLIDKIKQFLTKNKAFKVIVISIITISIITGSVFGILKIIRIKDINEDKSFEFVTSATNVIVMIGDGMGYNHIEATKAYNEEDSLFMESALIQSEATTYSRAVYRATDSAASGTALATGNKVNIGNIGMFRGEILESSTEYAISNGMATGIISTESVLGATPAAFSSHARNRYDSDDILTSQLDSGINLFFGANNDIFDDRMDNILDSGYDYIDNINDFDNNESLIFGAFDEVATSDSIATDTKPTLAELSVTGINYLNDMSDSGFFMMIEEAHIDKASHSNDINAMIEHTNAYDDAVEAVVQLANEIGNTLVIVTADHECGGLKYNGENKSELSDKMYTRGGHSGVNVPVFVFGDITGIPDVIDNTNVAYISKKIIDKSYYIA